MKNIEHAGRYYTSDDPPPSPPPVQQPQAEVPPFQWPEPKDDTPPWAKAIIQKQEALEHALLQAATPPENDDWRVDNEALARRTEERMKGLEQNLSAQINRLAAPMVMQDVTNRISQGLGEEAKQFVAKQLSTLSPEIVAAVGRNPAQVELLRNAAENVHARSNKNGRSMPNQTPVDNPRSDDGTPAPLSSEDEAEAQKMYRGFSSVAPDYKIEMARDAVRAARADQSFAAEIGRQFLERNQRGQS